MYDPKRERKLNETLSDYSAGFLILSVVLLFSDFDPEFFIPLAIGSSMIINIYNMCHVVWLAQQPSQESDPNEGAGLGYLFAYNFFLLLTGVLRGGVALYMMRPPTE